MKVETAISPQFDFCFALADLVSPAPHFVGWPGIRGDEPWLTEARSFGWGFWLGLSDLIESPQPKASTTDYVVALAAVPEPLILPRIKRSLLHITKSGRSSAETREWLHYIGLDSAAAGENIEARWNRPVETLVDILNSFRTHFDPVWNALRPELEQSALEVAEFAQHASLSDLAERLQLAMEFNERAKVMRTVRGGYSWKLSELGVLYLPPSAFNSRRINIVAEFMQPIDVYIPYFLSDIELPFGMARNAEDQERVDPWLVCRAIGDPSRADILRLIAKRPRPAAELLRELGLSKATVSHHIFQLREAGLITEKRVGRTVELAIRLQSLRGLSRALARELGGYRKS